MSIANPQFDQAAISAIVREVLRRVTASHQVASSAPATVTPPIPVAATAAAPTIVAPASQTTTQTDNTSYECDLKLIAMATLRGKLDNITTLRVKPKTIVTPAVRDELRDRKIALVFDLANDDSAGSRTQKTILLATTCNSTGSQLQQQLSATGINVQLQTNNCIQRLAKTVSERISASIRALIVSDQPFSAACFANRNANVQAAVIRDQRDATAAKADLNPNCIVLNSHHVKQLNLTSILQQLNW
jgi:ribose 5-phosphate isomerase RpiB